MELEEGFWRAAKQLSSVCSAIRSAETASFSISEVEAVLKHSKPGFSRLLKHSVSIIQGFGVGSDSGLQLVVYL